MVRLLAFSFTIILLPVLLLLRTRLGQWVTRALATVFAHPGSVLLLGLLVPLAHIFGEATGFLWSEAGWNLLTYLALLLLGYLLMADDRFDAALQKVWPWALGGALLLIVAMVAVWDYSDEVSDLQYVLQWTVRGVGAWFIVAAMLGAARRHLSFTNRFLRYTNELVLPFYILHQTVIVSVGFFIRDWDQPLIAKFPLLADVSFAIIMGLYEFAVRRIDLLRVLFGLKARPRPAAPALRPTAPAQA